MRSIAIPLSAVSSSSVNAHPWRFSQEVTPLERARSDRQMPQFCRAVYIWIYVTVHNLYFSINLVVPIKMEYPHEPGILKLSTKEKINAMDHEDTVYGFTKTLQKDPQLLGMIEVLSARSPDDFTGKISAQLLWLIIRRRAKRLSLGFRGVSRATHEATDKFSVHIDTCEYLF
jgi:hypothetical protein